MSRSSVIKMIDGATTPSISNVFVNNVSTYCALQITGTYSTATVAVQGVITGNSQDWTDIAVFNLSNLEIKTADMTGNGIYQAAVEGIPNVRINVRAISGGSITVTANFGGRG